MSLLQKLQAFGLRLGALGAGGVFAVALLDALLPLPGAIDAAVMYLAHTGPRHPAVYVAAAVLGSVLGVVMLYGVGRGGRRVNDRLRAVKTERPLPDWLSKNDFVAVAVAGLMPPPFPFKAFVLSSGALKLNLWSFVAAMTLARVLRFSVEAYLAALYGEAAAELMRAHYPSIGLVSVLLLVSAVLVYRYRQRRSAAPTRDTP